MSEYKGPFGHEWDGVGEGSRYIFCTINGQKHGVCWDWVIARLNLADELEAEVERLKKKTTVTFTHTPYSPAPFSEDDVLIDEEAEK